MASGTAHRAEEFLEQLDRPAVDVAVLMSLQRLELREASVLAEGLRTPAGQEGSDNTFVSR